MRIVINYKLQIPNLEIQAVFLIEYYNDNQYFKFKCHKVSLIYNSNTETVLMVTVVSQTPFSIIETSNVAKQNRKMKYRFALLPGGGKRAYPCHLAQTFCLFPVGLIHQELFSTQFETCTVIWLFITILRLPCKLYEHYISRVKR